MKTSRVVPLTAIAAAALIAACVQARRGPTVGAPLPAGRIAPAPVAPVLIVDGPAAVVLDVVLETRHGPGRPDQRRTAVEQTTEALGWPEARKRAFASAADGAVLEVEAAWSIREARILSLPAGLDPEAWEQVRQEIQAGYEEVKRTALARIGALLEPSREEELRLLEGLDEWFDAIR